MEKFFTQKICAIEQNFCDFHCVFFSNSLRHLGITYQNVIGNLFVYFQNKSPLLLKIDIQKSNKFPKKPKTLIKNNNSTSNHTIFKNSQYEWRRSEVTDRNRDYSAAMVRCCRNVQYAFYRTVYHNC